MIMISLPHLAITTLFLLLFIPVNSIYFQRTRFDSSDQSIILEGGAYTYVGTIEFNSHTYVCQVGQATYAQKIPLWDSNTKALSDFTTSFSFFIDNLGFNTSTAGLAFFIAPFDFKIPTNSACGFLGLYNLTTKDFSSNNQIVHVEFDTLPDPEWDPPFRHVGINSNSIQSDVFVPWNLSFHNGDYCNVLISYNSTTKNLSVSWRYDTTFNSQESNSISHVIDLREVIPELVTIGFTGTTADFTERHVLLSWEFNSNLEAKVTSGKQSNNTKLIVGIAVSLGVLIVVVISGFVTFWRRNLRRRELVAQTSITVDFEREGGPRRFSQKDLVSATNNFSDENKLGEGGFGAVYKAHLRELDMIVAVKKFSRGSKHSKKDYLTEVNVISRLRHRNLVQLIGWCHEKGDFLLVYQYMPNGSLDSHLFRNRSPLPWPVRHKIALGLASALLYLHEEWEKCVIHRDVKSSNIMLDSNFNVKLGDFGLARLMNHDVGPQTTRLVGTLGYLAPEYVSTGRASKESDVYSFGIVTLEIATGKKAIDPIEGNSEVSLVEWVWNFYGTGRLKLAVDGKLGVEFDEKQMECLLIVGLWCSHPDRNLRPSIRQAIQVMNFEAALPELPNARPVASYQVPSPSVSSGEPLITFSSLEVGR